VLRTIFVIIVTLLGVVYAFQGAIYTLLFYLWVAYFRPEAWVWYDWVRAINLSWIAGVATLLATLGARPVWRFNLQVGLLFAFLAQSTLSLIASAHGDYAFPYWVEFAKTITIAYVIALLVSDAPKYRLVLLTIGLSLGFEAAKQGWAGLILHPGSPNNNDLPLFGDNNGIAVGDSDDARGDRDAEGRADVLPIRRARHLVPGDRDVLARRLRRMCGARLRLPAALEPACDCGNRHRRRVRRDRAGDAGCLLGSHEDD